MIAKLLRTAFAFKIFVGSDSEHLNSVLRTQKNGHWKAIDETEASFEATDKLFTRMLTKSCKLHMHNRFNRYETYVC